MAVFGSTINPALGRVDYSPLAQGIAQGGMLSAQGIVNLGQGLAQGIQTYVQKQEQKKEEEQATTAIGRILKSNPGLATQLNVPIDEAGDFDKGALKAAIKGAGGPANALKLAATLEELGVQRQARQQQADAARFAGMFDNQSQMLSPLRSDALAQFSPEARALGQQMVTQRARQQAELLQTRAATQKAEAEAAALRAGKPQIGDATFEEANKKAVAMMKSGNLPEGTTVVTRQEGGRFVNETVTVPPRQVADPEAVERIRLSGKLMDADIASGEQARRLIPQTNSMISMLEGGLETGKLAPAKARFLSYAKAAGFDVDEAQLGKAEQFQAYATQQILGFISQTKGAVSNKENELFALMGPGFDRTPEGNKLLLRAIQERQKLDAAIGDNALRAIEEGWSQAKTAQERRKLIEAYDAKLPDPKSLGVKPASAPSAPVQPGSPTRRTYNPATGQLN